MLKSLRAQLSISILLMLFVTIALASALGSWFINREFEQYVAHQEKTRSENIVNDLSVQYNSITRTWSPDFLHTIGMYSLYDGYIIKVYDINGEVLWDAENHDMSLCGQIMADISERMESAKKTGGFSAHDYDLDHGGQKIGSVSIAYYDPYFFSENDFRFIGALNGALLVAGALAALFSIIAGSLLARRIARPVAKTAYIATQIAQGDYDIRFERGAPGRTKRRFVGVGSTRELNDLVEAINHLSGALAEQAHLRKQMTTDIAHELRTPLTAVGAHLEAMISGMWEATPGRLVACHEEIQRLGRLVSSLQQLANIESENLRLKKTRVDLAEIARSSAEKMAAEATKKNLSLTTESESSFVQADKERLFQVMVNLLSNAIKYTPEGGHIRIEVANADQTGIIKVIDDGSGISGQELPLIFERFYRTDKSRNRKTGGAGIGLAIAASIVAAHGGRITVDSQVDQGSSFTVLIPKNPTDTIKPSSHAFTQHTDKAPRA
jgi:signal transduction histidine kinase